MIHKQHETGSFHTAQTLGSFSKRVQSSGMDGSECWRTGLEDTSDRGRSTVRTRNLDRHIHTYESHIRAGQNNHEIVPTISYEDH